MIVGRPDVVSAYRATREHGTIGTSQLPHTMYGVLPYTSAMTPSVKSERLELRLTSEQKAHIERAAALSGRSITDFSIPVLTREADDVIQADSEWRISRQSWVAFTQALDRPAMPVDGLAELLSRRSAFTE